MGAVPLDPFAFRASARLDLGLVAACLPEKIVKSSVRFVAAEDRDQDIFQAPDNECTVGLVAELVALSCCLLDLNIRMGLREGGKVGIKEIYIELLLDGDRSSAVKLFQKQLVLQLVILELQVPYADILKMPTLFFKKFSCLTYSQTREILYRHLF